MSVQSVALASLTATYTDSEGDEGLDEEHHQHQNHHRESSSSSNIAKLDDVTQNSNLRSSSSSHQRATESPSSVFGRSTTNSPDSDDEAFAQGNDNYSGRNKKGNFRAGTNPTTAASRNAPTLVTDVTSRVQRLVSYFDDAVVSDDEMGTGTAFDETGHQNNGKDPATLTRRKRNNNNASAQSPKRQGELVSDGDGVRDDDDDDADAVGDEEDAWGVTIPPEPSGHCPVELQDKIANLYRKMESGLDMNLHIQQRKEFRNPSIYEKLIQFCSINEMGTNYPPDRFDPLKWGKDSYYEELARVQKNEMDKLEKARKEKTKIEIVTGTAKRANSNSTVAEDDAKRRKSKWDQVATGTSTSVKSNVVMSQPTLTTLTSSATGTKATVISAFGSLPKKRL